MDDSSSGTIPAELVKLESLVSEALARFESGAACPYSRRLSSGERTECLRHLTGKLGKRYRDCTLQSFSVYDPRQAEVVRRLSAFAGKMPDYLKTSGGLVLFGDAGTGKDHLLAALLKIAIAMHGLEVQWYDGGSLFDDFYFCIKSESELDLKRLCAALQKPHVLAISDPQPPQGPLSDAQIRRLRDTIDRRYRAGLSTWITTNLDRKGDAEALLTVPLLQRIKEGSAAILCDWPSYRERQKASW
jgi:DNA replication protein DnaC